MRMRRAYTYKESGRGKVLRRVLYFCSVAPGAPAIISHTSGALKLCAPPTATPRVFPSPSIVGGKGKAQGNRYPLSPSSLGLILRVLYL